MFAVLDIGAVLAMVVFFKRFGDDTPDTRARATRTMHFVYKLIAVLGAGFLVMGLTSDPMQIRTVVQSLIFLGLGVGGIAIVRGGRGREHG